MEEKQKRKRKVSIITVFLWIFLIAVMSVITLNSIKKKSALEIVDNSWNIGLVMYDRTSDTPNEYITDFTWNATTSSETKQLVMQINYNCTTGKVYNPGEIVIEIQGIVKDSFSEYYRRNYSLVNNNVTISADEVSDKIKNYDFSYEYNSLNNMYIFKNNKKVEENENFEGTIQIAYDLVPHFKNNLELQFKAKIKENIENADEIIAMESNVCNFYYTATKTLYTLKNELSLAPKSIYEKIGSTIDDYYWIMCQFDVSESLDAPIIALDESNAAIGEGSNCIRETLPEGCIIYDDNFTRIEPKENNTYYYLKTKKNNTENKYYIGYPKSKYNEGDEITNTAELWGRYEDEEQVQKLSEASSTASLADFDFEYTGKLYNITKSSQLKDINSGSIESNGGTDIAWKMGVTAFCTDGLMDVEIGDDLLYIGDMKLSEDKYDFRSIRIPVFYTYNKFTGEAGDVLEGYNYEVQVRYKGTQEYVVIASGVTGKNYNIVEFEKNVVGIKLVIKDLDKTIYQSSSNEIEVILNIHKATGYIASFMEYLYNFNYLQVYKKDSDGNRILANEVTPSSYITPSSIKLADYDISTYGKYMQRSYARVSVYSGKFELATLKARGDIINNVRKEKYETQYEIENILRIEDYCVEKDCIIKQYDILPSGVYLTSSKEEIIDEIYSEYRYRYEHKFDYGYIYALEYYSLKQKDGTKFKTLEELIDYIKENTTVDIDYNYRNSGRTKVSIIYNLNGIDWSYYLNHSSGFVNLGTKLKVEIPYDSILEYGVNYTNYVYNMWNNHEYKYLSVGYTNDNGQYDELASDLDNDGITREPLMYDRDTLNISHVVSSKQAVIKQVRTDLTKDEFVSKSANVSPGEEYTYKLKVTTGANSLKDIIIYDTLETTYDELGNEITKGWKGEFIGVDTSYAVSKGYAPKVYYSEEKNPGKLTEMPEKWQELTDDVDKSIVKSICVDLRYKEDGSEMELSSNNVVFILINMRAPEDDSVISSSSNMFSTSWRAKDMNGTFIDNINGIYSNKINVNIYKEENKTQNIEGKKIWEGDIYFNQQYRPKSVTVKLLQDGVEYLRKEVSEADNWEFVFEDVPVYKNIELEEYEYSIEEEEIPCYETVYDGYNIINTLKMINIEVTKIWDDNDNEKRLRPMHVLINVYDGEKLVEDIWLDGWYEYFGLKKTISLPMYREDGSKIEYRIDEEVPENLDFHVSGEWITEPNFGTEDGLEQYNKHYVKQIVGNTVTNKYINPDEKVKITGTKVWEDDENKAGKRPDSVILQLKSGDKVISEGVATKDTNWSYEFEVAKYDENKNEIKYYIDEKETPKFYEKELTDDFTVTNKFVIPDEKVKIKVVKIWEDLEDIYGKRPNKVTLQILNGEKVVKEKKVTKKDNWRFEIELPKYDENCNEIEYTVNEKENIEYYEKRISGYTIINKCIYEPDEKVIDLPSTSDINIFMYVVIFFFTIVLIVVVLLLLRKNKK